MPFPSTELKKVTEAHLRKAKKKLEAAKKLFQDGFYEDAVSRAYYAMYHAARACLALKGSSPKTHAGVISEFGRLFVATGEVDIAFGKALSIAKEDREDSDYEVLTEISNEEAEKVLNEAEVFIKKIEELLWEK